MGDVETRLRELAIALPQPSRPGANYVPYVRTGNLIFLTGQLAQWNGERRFVGKLGREFGVAEGQAAARLCAINVIAQVRAACGGDLDKVVRCVKVVGFVNTTPDFADHAKVMNGASDLFVSVFGDKGRHARSAVGMGSLPLGVACEVEAVFEVA